MLTMDAARTQFRGVIVRRVTTFLALGCACLTAPLATARVAQAEVFIAINKSAQAMTVVVNGREQYRWPVSTGRDGGPPSGSFRPDRLEREWYSSRYDGSPMPHSIFFFKGYAIHGTYYLSRLGQPASHGCVRLHPAHAATLFALVRAAGMNNTSIVVSESRIVATRQ